jgi:hypothetical protein
MLDVGREDALELASIDDQEPVEAFAADAHRALGLTPPIPRPRPRLLASSPPASSSEATDSAD